MCGRFTLYSSINNLKKVFDIDTVTCEMEASYNIAPGDESVCDYPGKRQSPRKTALGACTYLGKEPVRSVRAD